jgi:hypothetical protein
VTRAHTIWALTLALALGCRASAPDAPAAEEPARDVDEAATVRVAAVDRTKVESDARSLEHAGAGGLAEGGACGVSASSNLPGVTLRVEPGSCELTLAQAAAGVEFRYTVVVDAALSGVRPVPQDAGGCTRADASGLIVFGRIYGGDDNPAYFCRCDTGLCPPQPEAPVTIAAGEHAGVFAWAGQAGSGRSDYKKDPSQRMPPGAYTVQLSAKGTHEGRPFEALAKLQLTLRE